MPDLWYVSSAANLFQWLLLQCTSITKRNSMCYYTEVMMMLSVDSAPFWFVPLLVLYQLQHAPTKRLAHVKICIGTAVVVIYAIVGRVIENSKRRRPHE